MAQTERKLSAIMVADIAGFSTLMERDESGTFERVRALRENLINPTIEKHAGRVIKTTGDGFLAEFASATSALRCGIDLQRLNHAAQAALEPDHRLHMRIGLNVGDIIIDGADISGNGVNVAARLEPMAPPDGLCVSGSVRDHVHEDLGVVFEDLGEQTVKNIARPIRAYRINLTDAPLPKIKTTRKKHSARAILSLILAVGMAGGGYGYWHQASAPSLPSGPESKRISIVVLPFTTQSTDDKAINLADSITDDLTTEMSRILGSFVIGRDTAFTYKGRPVAATQLGVDLHVRYVLSGTVQRDGDHLRIGTQLTSAETGATLWSDRFDKTMADLFKVQDEITAYVSNTVNSTIVTEEARKSAMVVNADAYDLIALGKSYLYRRTTRDNLMQAITYGTAALKLQPDSVDALVLRSQAESGLAGGFFVEDRKAALKQADDDANQALILAPNYAQSHLVKGYADFLARKEPLAIEEFQKCLDIDSSLAYCQYYLGFMRHEMGHASEGPALIQKAIALDPRSSFIDRWIFGLGDTYLYAGDIEHAVYYLEKAASLGEWNNNFIYLAAAYVEANRLDEARAMATKAHALLPTLTAAKFFAGANSDNPVYLARRRQIADDLVRAGIPKE